ncbi:MAG: UDP-N-acetylenolpyruvoylglucosamine reductase [Parcubacteria group bacterium 21-54-25]|nr:MAG: UDP-N-acetylenolpyruvoylglucosamine reductase [Parcubacteria group bacterium 21-54-25]HQU07440.1 UDP-N-acetylmuramate dehydrogenase [Candidatus Paceibacterota bacterium]
MIDVQEQVPLAPLTTLGVGGAARFFVEARSVEDVQETLAVARERRIPLYVLGGGSNVVIADEGIDGLVLKVAIGGVTSTPHTGRVELTASAGVEWDALVAHSIAEGLSGFECLSGIPGTVGGAVVANIGAYSAQVSDTVVAVRALDRAAPEVLRTFTSQDCNFTYHNSVFAAQAARYIVIDATFSLERRPMSAINYQDYRFARANDSVVPRTLAEVREAVRAMRKAKGNLLGAGTHSYQSAGSFFHMPYVSSDEYEHIRAVATKLDAEKEARLAPWAWLQADGRYRIAPGFLLEFTEFQKGYVRGRAGISPKHTLAVINLGGATAAEIVALARDMHAAVKKRFGISLEREVVYLGVFEANT